MRSDVSRKRKLRQKLLSSNRLPSDVRFAEVHLLLEDIGYERMNTDGSHITYSKGEKIKTIITEGGRRVSRQYLKRVQENVIVEEAL